MAKINVGINGFGRIGRCVARQLLLDERVQLKVINDTNPDIDNLSYLFNYDSIYGRAEVRSQVVENKMLMGDQRVEVYSSSSLGGIPWHDCGVDVVVDATGVSEHIEQAHELVKVQKIKKVIFTNAPKKGVDKVVVLGVNEHELKESDHVIASSICDANAIAHVFKALHAEIGIESGFITSVHPWLSYQNLVDGSLRSQSSPGMFWKDYSLGRSSVGALIPKNTTAASAVIQVLPELEGRIDAFSYRIPTSVVTSADLTLQMSRDTSLAEIRKVIHALSAKIPDIVGVNSESLVSRDYERVTQSVVIDDQWTNVLGKRMVKIVLWYDNEWGYSSRVVDLVNYLSAIGK
ncbi:MAG: type I glyceraldehyde-3-phosphate dehydrogenase [Bdellovibrio sp.]